MDSHLDPVDYQCKLMNSRVDNVSKHFAYLLQGMSAYARKLALLRDKGDDINDIIIAYVNNEPHNTSTRRQLHECTHWLAMVQDFRHLAAVRISSKFLPTLQAYQKTTSDLRGSIKKCTTAHDKAKASLVAANKIKVKHGDASSMFHTAFEQYRSNKRETSHQAEILHTHAKEFEQKKLTDMKKLLLDFITSEVMYHCRAVAMLTSAYHSVRVISVEDDLNEFLDEYERMDDTESQEAPTGPPAREVTRPATEMRGSVSQPVLYQRDNRDEVESDGDYPDKRTPAASGLGRTQSAIDEDINERRRQMFAAVNQPSKPATYAERRRQTRTRSHESDTD